MINNLTNDDFSSMLTKSSNIGVDDLTTNYYLNDVNYMNGQSNHHHHHQAPNFNTFNSNRPLIQSPHFISNKLNSPFIPNVNQTQPQMNVKLYSPCQKSPVAAQTQFQAQHQFKTMSMNDEFISPLSNSSSTSSTSSSFSCSSSSSLNNLNSVFKSVAVTSKLQGDNCNGSQNSVGRLDTSFDGSANKHSQGSKTSQANMTAAFTAMQYAKKSGKKKNPQTTNELDEERTNQLVSDLLRNIKEKTKELENLNQNLKSGSNNGELVFTFKYIELTSITPDSRNFLNNKVFLDC